MGPKRTLARTQASAPWTALLNAEPATLLVMGDYYIFGETDERAGINRLVREYGINSREDLDAWLMDNPKAMGNYRDLDLYYLPVGAAFALRSVVPVIPAAGACASAENLCVVIMASDLTPEMLKRNNIVYLGYLSGLGVLRAPVFAGSRFQVGETYDELIDAQITPKGHYAQARKAAPAPATPMGATRAAATMATSLPSRGRRATASW